jgi:hypothetical protein
VCPRLTELTVLCPHPGLIDLTERVYLGLVGRVRSAMPELVNACKALPDFDTFQIVHSPDGGNRELDKLREHLGSVEDIAISCLKEPETGCREGEGEGRKKIMVRIIELVASGSRPAPVYLDSVKVEEYEV